MGTKPMMMGTKPIMMMMMQGVLSMTEFRLGLRDQLHLHFKHRELSALTRYATLRLLLLSSSSSSSLPPP
jgi:hypothetical protein